MAPRTKGTHTPIDRYDVDNAREHEKECGGGFKRGVQITEFYTNFDKEGVLSDIRLRSQMQSSETIRELQQYEEAEKKAAARAKHESLRPQAEKHLKSKLAGVDLSMPPSEEWPEWDDTYADWDAKELFGLDFGDSKDPIIGVPGKGGIKWSEGMDIIDEAFPDAQISAETDELLRSMGISPGPEIPKKKKNNANKNKNRKTKKKATKEVEVDNASGAGTANLTDDDAPFPPTPGVPSNMQDEQIGDIVMDIADLDQSSGKDLSVGSQDHTDFDMDFPPTPGAPSNMEDEQIGDIVMETADLYQISSKALSVGSHDHTDFDMGLPPTPGMPAADDWPESEGNEDHSESHHPFPSNPYSNETFASPASSIVLVPTLDTKGGLEGQPLAKKAKKQDKINTNDNLSANTSGKSLNAKNRMNSATSVKSDGDDSAPQTPSKGRGKKPVSTAPPPGVSESPLKLLKKSVQMGGKSSFSEAHASSVKDAAGTKGKKSSNTGIIAKTDDELLENFEFIPEDRFKEKGMTAPAVRNLVRHVKSLAKIHNGVSKQSMIDHYMKWQKDMQARQQEEETSGGEKGGLGSDEEEEDEEDEDMDAEAAESDEMEREESKSPEQGLVTPGPPLQSPFTGVPRSTKSSPFMDKLTEAAKDASKSSPDRRRSGRSKTPAHYKE